MGEVADKVKTIVARSMGVEESRVTPNASFVATSAPIASTRSSFG